MNSQIRIRQLKALAPFRQFSDLQLERLCNEITVQPVLAGSELFESEGVGGKSYFLLSGSICLQDEAGNQQLISPDTERSLHELIPDGLAGYRAVAKTDCNVIFLKRDRLVQLLLWQQAMQDVLLDLQSNSPDIDWLEKLLVNPLFSRVPAQNIREMLKQLKSIELPAGSQVIREGAVGESCYFLRSGLAQVSREENGRQRVLAELDEGACFGEEALLSEQPRNANVRMLEDGQVLELSRQSFISLLQEPVVAECNLTQAQPLIEQMQAQWLDVRRLDEYEQAHAWGALHMPLDLLRLKSRLLSQHKLYICYCNDGKRSQNAVFLLSQLGFNAKVLVGGTDALSPEQQADLLSEHGAGYLVRQGGLTEQSI